MNSFDVIPDIILDLIFNELNQDDLNEASHVSKSWFWASVRRIRSLRIDANGNLLESMTDFYNRDCLEPHSNLNWLELLANAYLDELVVEDSSEVAQYLLDNGCQAKDLCLKYCLGVSPTMAALKDCPRLKSFMYFRRPSANDTFLLECFKSLSDDTEFVQRLNNIYGIKLKTGETEEMFITELYLSTGSFPFVQKLIQKCPELEKFTMCDASLTSEWFQLFPPNLKRIELSGVDLDVDLAVMTIGVFTDLLRNLLPFVCQNYKTLECFDFRARNQFVSVHQIFPQTNEESIEYLVGPLHLFNTKLHSTRFTPRKFAVTCKSLADISQLIPPAKEVVIRVGEPKTRSKFSPFIVCSDPTKWEKLTITNIKGGIELNCFQGLDSLVSLQLHHANADTLKGVLEGCRNLKKLTLVEADQGAIGRYADGRSYETVAELCLRDSNQRLEVLWIVFPRLVKFEMEKRARRTQKDINKDHQVFKSICQHLVANGRSFGAVFHYDLSHYEYITSDELSVSLETAQDLLNDCEECFLKGFKMIPRFSDQEVIYSLESL